MFSLPLKLFAQSDDVSSLIIYYFFPFLFFVFLFYLFFSFVCIANLEYEINIYIYYTDRSIEMVEGWRVALTQKKRTMRCTTNDLVDCCLAPARLMKRGSR